MSKEITNCIVKKQTKNNPIWLMRQAGRDLPAFREIRKKNQDFIKLCLNPKLATEITLQPIKRFDFDGAIIFSDILMLPYGLNQKVEFEKGFGPRLEELKLNNIKNTSENDFTIKVQEVYQAITKTSSNPIMQNKDMIGFVGAPWTILVYMVNCLSPKNGLKKDFFKDPLLINETMILIEKFLKLHIQNQVRAGANIIQIFDSWAGLLESKIPNYILDPTLRIVEFTKKLGVPVICFPRGIKDYKNFCEIVRPDAVNIDYNVDPKNIVKQLDIPVQGGLDPKILLSNKENLKKSVENYLNIFKDHPYIFNLGHGILPETKIEMVEEMIKIVREFK